MILWPTRDSLEHPGAEAVVSPALVAGGHRPSLTPAVPRPARSQKVEKESKSQKQTFDSLPILDRENGHVASSVPRPRHHANSFAKCQGHQPAHFGTSNVE